MTALRVFYAKVKTILEGEGLKGSNAPLRQPYASGKQQGTTNPGRPSSWEDQIDRSRAGRLSPTWWTEKKKVEEQNSMRDQGLKQTGRIRRVIKEHGST